MIDNLDLQDANRLRSISSAIKWGAMILGFLVLVFSGVGIIVSVGDLQRYGREALGGLTSSLLLGAIGIAICALVWAVGAACTCVAIIAEIQIRAHMRSEAQRSKTT